MRMCDVTELACALALRTHTYTYLFVYVCMCMRVMRVFLRRMRDRLRFVFFSAPRALTRAMTPARARARAMLLRIGARFIRENFRPRAASRLADACAADLHFKFARPRARFCFRVRELSYAIAVRYSLFVCFLFVDKYIGSIGVGSLSVKRKDLVFGVVAYPIARVG